VGDARRLPGRSPRLYQAGITNSELQWRDEIELKVRGSKFNKLVANFEFVDRFVNIGRNSFADPG
jgi:hypothetical protein